MCRDRDTGPGSGYYSLIANATGSLQIWAEHRYYADTAANMPTADRAYLTVEQALLDHIELVLAIQNIYSMSTNPVIAIGAGYGKHAAMHLRNCDLGGYCICHKLQQFQAEFATRNHCM